MQMEDISLNANMFMVIQSKLAELILVYLLFFCCCCRSIPLKMVNDTK